MRRVPVPELELCARVFHGQDSSVAAGLLGSPVPLILEAGSAAGRVATSQPGTTGSYCPGTTAHRSEQIKHGSRANAADQQGAELSLS